MSSQGDAECRLARFAVKGKCGRKVFDLIDDSANCSSEG